MKYTTLVNDEIIIYDDFCHWIWGANLAAKTKDWEAVAKGLLKAELKRRDLTYADLADKLRAIGIKDNDRNIANKIARGSFTAVFLLQCLTAIGCKTLHLDDGQSGT